MANRTKLTQETRAKFLELLREEPNIKRAAEAIGVSRGRLYELREEDPGFDAAWREALEDGADVLESEAWRRAVHGIREPVFYQGQEVGAVTRYSDQLLTLLLKAHRKEKFSERQQVSHSGRDPVTQALAAIDGQTTGPPCERPGAYLPPAEDDTYDNVAPENGDSEEDE